MNAAYVMWAVGILVAVIFSLIGIVFGMLTSRINKMQEKIEGLQEDMQVKAETIYTKLYAEVNELEKRRSAMSTEVNTGLTNITRLLYEIKEEIPKSYVSKAECDKICVHNR